MCCLLITQSYKNLSNKTILNDRIGWVQLFFKLLFLSVTSKRKTRSSSKNWSNEFNLQLCLTFVTSSLFAEPSKLIFSTNALFYGIFIIFFLATSILAILRNCSEIPICWCSSGSFLFRRLLGKVVLNFKTNANNFFIPFQLAKRVSNISNILIFTSVLLTWEKRV